MKADKVKAFNDYRARMNEKLLAAPNNKVIKRIFNVDTNAYLPGALDVKTHETQKKAALPDNKSPHLAFI